MKQTNSFCGIFSSFSYFYHFELMQIAGKPLCFYRLVFRKKENEEKREKKEEEGGGSRREIKERTI